MPPDGSLHLLSFRGAPVEDRISARGLQARLAGERRDVRELAHAARAGDGNARRAFTTFSAELAEFLEPCVLAFAPTCVVVGGSIARAWDLLAAGLETAFPRVQVTAAERIDESALLGAALHASRGRGSLPVAGQRGSGPGADHRDRRRTPS